MPQPNPPWPKNEWETSVLEVRIQEREGGRTNRNKFCTDLLQSDEGNRRLCFGRPESWVIEHLFSCRKKKPIWWHPIPCFCFLQLVLERLLSLGQGSTSDLRQKHSPDFYMWGMKGVVNPLDPRSVFPWLHCSCRGQLRNCGKRGSCFKKVQTGIACLSLMFWEKVLPSDLRHWSLTRSLGAVCKWMRKNEVNKLRFIKTAMSGVG